MNGAISVTKILTSFLFYFKLVRKVVAAKNLWIILCVMFACLLSNTAGWAQEVINSGQCLNGTISSPGSVDTFRFYGDAGDAVVIVATKTDGSLWPQIFLYAPDGTREATAWSTDQARIDNQQLTKTGWHTIEVEDYSGGRTGGFRLCLITIPGATSKGQIDSGQCMAGTVDRSTESFEFNGDAGDAVVIVATQTDGTLWPQVFLYAPDGTREATAWSTDQARIDNHQLAKTGRYTIEIEDYSGGRTGGFKLCLIKNPGATSKGPINSGECMAGTVDRSTESFEFNGDAGDAVVIVATQTDGTLWPQIFLYAPDGTREATAWSTDQARIDNHQLAKTGRYIIEVEDYSGGRTGGFRLCLITIPGATSKGQIYNDQCIEGTVDRSIESFTFYGNEDNGLVIVATKTDGSLWPQIFLYAPDGTREATAWSTSQARIDNHQLAKTGWYTIEVEDYSGGRTGEFDLCLRIIGDPKIGFSYLPVEPCRIVDSRNAGGIINATAERDFYVYGPGSVIGPQGGKSAGCPSPGGEPYAAHINMTAVDPTGKGNLQAFPVGSGPGAGLIINYNAIGTNLANAGTVKSITGGGPDITVTSRVSSVHAVIDVLGYYYPAGELMYKPVPPCRVVDTRNAGGIIDAGDERDFHVYGSGGTISGQGGTTAGCSSPLGEPLAAHINVVAVDPTGKGNLQAFPLGAGPGAGLIVNYNAIDTNLANAGTVKSITGGGPDITVTSRVSSVHAVIDVLGYYYRAGDLMYKPVTPCRIVDTRNAGGIINATAERDFYVYGPGSVIGPQGGKSAGCPSPGGEPYAAHINVVAVDPTGKGNLQAFPLGAGPGAGLIVNYNAIDTNLANAGTVKSVSGGGPDITVTSRVSSVHAVIDVLGYYYPAP